MKNSPYFEQINRPDNTSAHYFAALNSHKGFISYFDTLLHPDDQKQVYILKGGPGIGKSTLMNKAALTAESKGLTALRYHCSSDPTSLDAVVIRETGTVILDGTAPHAFEPLLPGARDHLVDLSGAWDFRFLMRNKETIEKITAEKKLAYQLAYRHLAAAKQAKDVLENIGESCVDKQKMHDAVKRFVSKNLVKNKESTPQSVTEIIQNGLTCQGNIRFFTEEKTAKKCFFIKDNRHIANVFFQTLLETAEKKELSIKRDLHPLDPTSTLGLVFPKASVCISLYDDAFCKALDKAEINFKIINLDRFVNAEAFREKRSAFRFADKCYEHLLNGAFVQLEQAGKCHEQLERIYGKATDYKKTSAVSGALIRASLTQL